MTDRPQISKKSCFTKVDYVGRFPDMGMGNRIVPQVCANLAGEYVNGEMRYVCFQAQTGIDVSYKFEYFAQATKGQILYENTCQTNMSSIMLNADNGPGPCKGDPMGGGSVENGYWKFTWVFSLFFLSVFLHLPHFPPFCNRNDKRRRTEVPDQNHG